jgi:hypothetical protein
MEPRLSIITLAVAEVESARRFYEKGLGWEVSSASTGDVVFFRTRGTVVALYPRALLADDAGVDDAGTGFRGVSLAHNVRTKEEVALVLREAEAAGGKIIKPAQDVFWGGHSGYFADLDGHLWEVAWNPLFPLNERGEVQLPA